jgi:hypothetical protein
MYSLGTITTGVLAAAFSAVAAPPWSFLGEPMQFKAMTPLPISRSHLVDLERVVLKRSNAHPLTGNPYTHVKLLRPFLTGTLFTLSFTQGGFYQQGRSPGEQPSPGPAPMATSSSEEEVSWGTCQTYCSQVDLGESVAEIRRKVAIPGADAQALALAVKADKIEVTTFADGFERGLFAVITPAPVPKAAAPRALLSASGQALPGLEQLRVIAVATSQDRTKPALRLQPSTEGGVESATIQITGLQPGMNYYWRLPASASRDAQAQEVLACRAAICPVDYQQEPKKD